MLAAVDIVADPSAPNAFVNGIMEGAEWVWDGDVLREKQISEYAQAIEKASKRELEEKCLSVFTDFISKL
jgi:cation diffusion facilitator CzcD-associated flavoprotein CzcO